MAHLDERLFSEVFSEFIELKDPKDFIREGDFIEGGRVTWGYVFDASNEAVRDHFTLSRFQRLWTNQRLFRHKNSPHWNGGKPRRYFPPTRYPEPLPLP